MRRATRIHRARAGVLRCASAGWRTRGRCSTAAARSPRGSATATTRSGGTSATVRRLYLPTSCWPRRSARRTCISPARRGSSRRTACRASRCPWSRGGREPEAAASSLSSTAQCITPAVAAAGRADSRAAAAMLYRRARRVRHLVRPGGAPCAAGRRHLGADAEPGQPGDAGRGDGRARTEQLRLDWRLAEADYRTIRMSVARVRRARRRAGHRPPEAPPLGAGGADDMPALDAATDSSRPAAHVQHPDERRSRGPAWSTRTAGCTA